MNFKSTSGLRGVLPVSKFSKFGFNLNWSSKNVQNFKNVSFRGTYGLTSGACSNFRLIGKNLGFVFLTSSGQPQPNPKVST